MHYGLGACRDAPFGHLRKTSTVKTGLRDRWKRQQYSAINVFILAYSRPPIGRVPVRPHVDSSLRSGKSSVGKY